MAEPDNKNFFTTLPGILTGIASLITALVGLMSLVHKPAETAQPAIIAGVPISLPPQPTPVKPQGCEKAVGSWDWAIVGGVVTFEKDGRLVWRKNAQDVFPSATGVWNCIDAHAQEMTLFWPLTGITDTVTLSADGRSISGTNYTGFKISGKKR